MIISFLFSILLTSQIPLPPIDPDLNYRTKTTENFYIHHPESLETVAYRISQICEPIHATLTKQLNHKPSGRTHVVLLNNTDDANGFSTPLPYNSVYLNIAPPGEGSSLDHYDDWLVTLFTHEFTHTIHIDQAEGINRILRYVFGRFWVPNAAQPQWLIEGYAVYNESKHTSAGRGKSAYIDMAVRTATLQNEFVPIDRATYWNHEFPYGNAAYWYGGRFYQYLSKKYGEEKMAQFALENSRWPIVGWFNLKTRKIFDKSFSRLWKEWQEDEKKYWRAQVAQYQTKYRAKNIEDWKLNGQGVWSSEKDVLYAPLRRQGESILASLKKNEKGEYEVTTVEPGLNPKRLSLFGDRLYFAQTKSTAFNSYSEIVSLDLRKEDQRPKDEDRMLSTFEARLRDPFAHSSGIYAVRTKGLETQLVRLPLFPKTQKELTPDWLEKNIEVLYTASGFDNIHSPSLSPDGKTILFSLLKEQESRDLYLLDIETRQLRRLTEDRFEYYFPSFSPDGQFVIFTSDQVLGNSQSQVFNTYAIHLLSRRLHQLTDSWRGTFWPVWKNGKLFVGEYTTLGDGGFEAQLADAALPSSQSRILEREKITRSKPSILENSEVTPVSDSEYKIGSTLLPRYLAPMIFITEEEAAIGGFTGSNDPLGFHRWSLFGAYLSGPNQPIGSLVYSYLGFAPVSLQFVAASGITNYGRVLIRQLNSGLIIDPQDYYERSYYLSLGAGTRWLTKGRPSGWSSNANLFFESRSSLNDLPVDLLSAIPGNPSVQTIPEEGEQIGVGFRTAYSTGSLPSFYSFSQDSASSFILDLEYSPKLGFSDFQQLSSILSGSYFLEFVKNHVLAGRMILGNQWLDTLYQKSFQLGGSFGSSAFSQLNRRSFALRGFDFAQFRGEGLIVANLEYRFPLIKSLPGAGTAPIWLRNIHGALFSDAGQTFQFQDEENAIQYFGGFVAPQKPALNRFNWSIGAELKTDLSLFYGPPFTYRLGYAQVLYQTRPSDFVIGATEVGEWVLNDNISQIYFQIGQSF